jgi:tetratricopeptide (TPR) repeat protein
VLALGVWLATDGGGAAGGAGATAAAGTGERVAVFPFRVRGGAGSGYLAGALGTLLSAGLDGAGDLQAVDPRALGAVAEETEGSPGPGDASDAARDLGADLYVMGDAVAASERVHLTAGLYRPGSSPPVARASVEGRRDELFRLVDRLAAELLSDRYPEEEVPLARRAARTTGSLPALQAYLEGEERFRAGRFAAAVAAYRRAVEADPEFALAHHRLSVTAEWVGDGDLAARSAERAVEHASRLPPRERRLLSAHRTSLRGDAAEAERRYREILATYPSDLEAWYQLGEILFHYGPAVGRSIGEARRAFGEVAELSPDHVPSLVHLARIAAAEGRAADVSRLAGRVLELVPGSAQAWEMRALAAVAGGERGDLGELVAGLEDAGDRSVRLATWTVAVFGEDLTAAARTAELLTAPWRSPEARRLGREWRAELAVARGRWSEAGVEPAGGIPAGADDPVSPFHAYRGAFLASLPFAGAPDSIVATLRERLAAPDGADPRTSLRRADEGPTELARLLPRLRRFALAQLAAREGDHDRALAHADELESPPEAPGGLPLAERLGRIVRARVAWQRGDPARALELLGEEQVETRSSLMFGRDYVQPFERYLRGRILEAAGRPGDALPWYGSFRHQHVHHLVYLAPSQLRRAEILEAAEKPVEAAGHYRAFLELWDDPDPELAPTRRAAERRLERLASVAGGSGR